MKKIFSLSIFLSVLSLVILGANFMINKSLEIQPNSKIVADLLMKNKKTYLASIDAVENPTVLGSTTLENIEISDKKNNECQDKLVLKLQNTKSIVNYLNQLNLNYSFSNRSLLAELHKINNYTGTAEQNIQLIYSLAIDEICPNFAK